MSEGSSVQDVARKFTHLNAKWSDVTDDIYDKFKILKEASHEYGEFRGKYNVCFCFVLLFEFCIQMDLNFDSYYRIK
jgi:hypothetical protein